MFRFLFSTILRQFHEVRLVLLKYPQWNQEQEQYENKRPHDTLKRKIQSWRHIQDGNKEHI
jgi:hypothetical protein